MTCGHHLPRIRRVRADAPARIRGTRPSHRRVGGPAPRVVVRIAHLVPEGERFPMGRHRSLHPFTSAASVLGLSASALTIASLLAITQTTLGPIPPGRRNPRRRHAVRLITRAGLRPDPRAAGDPRHRRRRAGVRRLVHVGCGAVAVLPARDVGLTARLVRRRLARVAVRRSDVGSPTPAVLVRRPRARGSRCDGSRARGSRC